MRVKERLDIPAYTTFEEIKLRASRFCSDRQWEKFHKPPSIAMALAGECGEISEIFQWKGDLEQMFKHNVSATYGLNLAEVIHLGEEIADVFIYTTRLCDICKIDFNASVTSRVNSPTDLPNFASMQPFWIQKVQTYRSPRQIVFSLQKSCGELCGLFSQYDEMASCIGLDGWATCDKSKLKDICGQIGEWLFLLAAIYNLDVGYVVARKFQKNEEKYPAVLSRGSSAKYTAYQNSLLKANFSLLSIISAAGFGIVVGIVASRCNKLFPK